MAKRTYRSYSFRQIIEIADKAYPDGLVKRAAYGEKVGDTLAEFIAVELKDTFDPKATCKDQLSEAYRVMNAALAQLDEVVEAFQRAGNKVL